METPRKLGNPFRGTSLITAPLEPSGCWVERGNSNTQEWQRPAYKSCLHYVATLVFWVFSSLSVQVQRGVTKRHAAFRWDWVRSGWYGCRHPAFRLWEAIPRHRSPRQKTPKKDTTWELENEKLFINGWLEKPSFLELNPEWPVGVSLLLASSVRLPNGRSSTERQSHSPEGGSERPSSPVPAEETKQREASSHHKPTPPQLADSSSHL